MNGILQQQTTICSDCRAIAGYTRCECGHLNMQLIHNTTVVSKPYDKITGKQGNAIETDDIKLNTSRTQQGTQYNIGSCHYDKRGHAVFSKTCVVHGNDVSNIMSRPALRCTADSCDVTAQWLARTMEKKMLLS